MSSQDQQRLRVIIIGGGLAGALAGRVLREKHDVTIYERSSNQTEVSAAITIGPNGVRILDTLHFDRCRAGSLPVKVTKVYDREGNLKLDKQTECAEKYGADWLAHHRGDLRTEFIRLATADSETTGIPGQPAKVVYGREVVDVDPEAGMVTFANGDVLMADLIVAADGIKSVVRPFIVGNAAFTTARPSGLSAFRFTIPSSEIEEKVGQLPEIIDRNKPVCLSMVYSFDETLRSVVIYPCRDFQLINFVCITPDKSLKSEATESWSAAGDRDETLSIFHDYPPWVLDYLRIATNIKLWQLRDQDPLPSYVKGRTVLVGDAAHAMTPHQGQGSTQAVEDAEGFRLFLQLGVTRDDVPNILKDFDSVRRPRASTIQNNTRKVVDKRTAEEVTQFEKINWTYPGITEGLARVKVGQNLTN